MHFSSGGGKFIGLKFKKGNCSPRAHCLSAASRRLISLFHSLPLAEGTINIATAAMMLAIAINIIIIIIGWWRVRGQLATWVFWGIARP